MSRTDVNVLDPKESYDSRESKCRGTGMDIGVGVGEDIEDIGLGTELSIVVPPRRGVLLLGILLWVWEVRSTRSWQDPILKIPELRFQSTYKRTIVTNLYI